MKLLIAFAAGALIAANWPQVQAYVCAPPAAQKSVRAPWLPPKQP